MQLNVISGRFAVEKLDYGAENWRLARRVSSVTHAYVLAQQIYWRGDVGKIRVVNGDGTELLTITRSK